MQASAVKVSGDFRDCGGEVIVNRIQPGFFLGAQTVVVVGVPYR